MSPPSLASRLRARAPPSAATVAAVSVACVRVPAKINLSLRVGPLRADGYHELTTIFHAVSLYDEVTVSPGPAGSRRHVAVRGTSTGGVPTGDDNLAARAAVALARHAGLADADVMIDIVKAIPVAGGMAGGSADAAATLVACRRLWRLDVDDSELAAIAAGLGSDVPFALMGHTARGTGRGEVLTPVLASGDLHWVVALIDGELSTPAVYAEWDRLCGHGSNPVPGDDAALLAALRAGDARQIAPLLHNDLERAAVSLRPGLARVLEAGVELGALAGRVSGSGPTCVFLAADSEAAISLAAELAGSGLARGVRHAVGPVAGARIVG